MEFQDAYWKYRHEINSKSTKPPTNQAKNLRKRQGNKHFRTDQKTTGYQKQESLMTMQNDKSPRRSLLSHHEEISEISPNAAATLNEAINFHGPMRNKTLNQKSKRNSIVNSQNAAAGKTFQFVRMAKNGPQIDPRTPRDIDEYKIQQFYPPKIDTNQMMKTHRIVSQITSKGAEGGMGGANDEQHRNVHKDLIISHRHQLSDDKTFVKRFREDLQRSKTGKQPALFSGLAGQRSDQSSSIGSNEYPLISNSKIAQDRQARDIRDNQSSTVDFNGSLNSQMYTFREQLKVAQIAEKRFTQRSNENSQQRIFEGNSPTKSGKQGQQMMKERNLMAKIIESSSKLVLKSPKKIQNTASKASSQNMHFSPLAAKIQRESFLQKLGSNDSNRLQNKLPRKHTISVDMESPRSAFVLSSREQLRQHQQQQQKTQATSQTKDHQQQSSHEYYALYDQNPMFKSKQYEHVQSKLPPTNLQRQFNSPQNQLNLHNSVHTSPEKKKGTNYQTKFYTDQKDFSKNPRNNRLDSLSGGQKYQGAGGKDLTSSHQKQTKGTFEGQNSGQNSNEDNNQKAGEFQIEEAFDDLRNFNHFKAEKQKVTYNESAVQEIIKKAKADLAGSGDKGPTRKMIGRMPYKVPLEREHLIKIEEFNRKRDVQGELKNLAKNELSMEGKIQVRDVAERLSRKRVDKQSTVKNYVNNFSQVQDVLQNAKKGGSMNQFAKKIEGQIIQEKFKADYKQALKQMITDARENTKKKENGEDSTAEEKDDLKKQQTFEEMTEQQKRAIIFPQNQKEDQMQIQKVGHQFMQKIKYLDVFRQSIPENAKGIIGSVDPRIKYFKGCKEVKNSALPILDKIFRKTLCLQEYTLDKGHCQGLAAACEFLDNNVVNRALFNNCGIDGDEFAKILEGLSKLQEVKSIVYKMNAINKNSIQNLIPIFRKRLPHHLEELKLIDCQIHSNLIEEILEKLEERSQLKTLAIVNAHQSESSFAQLVSFVETSDYLEDLDISWSMLRPQTILNLLQVLRSNRQMKCLSLAYNQLFDEEKNQLTVYKDGAKVQYYTRDTDGKMIPEDILDKQQEELTFTTLDQEIMNCFTDFVKYNPYLVHLDLTSTGLTRKQLMFFGKLLTRAQSLKSIHLSANPCLYDPEEEAGSSKLQDRENAFPRTKVINWLQKRIRAIHQTDYSFIPHYKPKPEPVVMKKPLGGGGLAGKLFGGFGSAKKDPKEEAQRKEQEKWKDLRAGIKLRNIVNSKRMNENSLQAGYEQRKLVIQRHLGFKGVIKEGNQWQILTDVKDECFYCGQHLLTLVIWTPRIGQLGCLNTPGIEDYYKSKIEGNFADDDFMVDLSNEPQIAGQFTNWQYHQMQNVITFAQANDLNPPNFKKQLIGDKIIRAEQENELDGSLNQAEKDALKNRKNSYYSEYWPQVLMRILRYKMPQIANSDHLSELYKQRNQSEKSEVYCWVGYVKPGRHNYAIKHDNEEIYSDGEEGQYDKKVDLFKQKTMKMGKKSTKNFYVHELLAGFRQEQLPEYAIERHIVRTETVAVKAKKVFEEWEEDTMETLNHCFRQDAKYFQYSELCKDSQGTTDKQEKQKIENQIISNYAILKKVYHFLQSKSKYYPRVDTYTIRKYFLDPMGIIPGVGRLPAHEYDVVLSRVNSLVTHDGDSKIETEQNPMNHFLRCQFIEFTIRVACRMYGIMPGEDLTDHEDYQSEYKLMKEPHKAIQFFINLKLVKFCDDQNICWQEFRDDKLWCFDMEEVFTLNEKALMKLYDRFAYMHRGKNGKPDTATWITYQDIEYFMKVDLVEFGFQKKDARFVFGMSKMTVIDEFTGNRSDGLYQKLRYVEFLEVLSRIAELFFEESEMQELELAKKIEYLLDEILPIVGAKRVKQRTIIEDFSESDDDY